MRKFYLVFLGVMFGMAPMVGWAQISMTTTSSYAQDFNTLANSGTPTWVDNSTILNWYSQRTGSGTTYAPNTGTTTAGGLYSFGAASPSTERSLGTIGSGNAAAGSFAHGVLLRNSSSAAITALSVAYTGEQWRRENVAAQTITFWYKVSTSPIINLTAGNNSGWIAVTSLNFVSLQNSAAAIALDGNLSANRTVISAIAIPSLNLAVNDYIMLKWEDPDHGGNDHGLAIDDVTIAWTATAPCTSQTISGLATTDTKTYGDAAYSLSATASSSLAVGYASSNTSVATISGSTVTIVGAGTTTITASQAGNSTYCAATNVTQTLTVNSKTLTISGLTANNKVYDGTTAATLSGTPTLNGIVGSDIVTISGTPTATFADALVGTGKAVTVTGYTISASIPANYTLTQPTGLTADITPAPTPVVTGGSASGTVGTAFSYNISATNTPTGYAVASGTLPPGLALNTSTGAITGTPTTAGSFSVDVTASNGSGTSVPATINFTIAKGNQVITGLPATDSKIYGTANYSLVATSGSGLAVTYTSSTPATATVTGSTVAIVAVGTTTITASQAGDANWNPATNITQNLTITAKPLTITGLTGNNKTYDATAAATLSGTAALNGVIPADISNVLLGGTIVSNFASATIGVNKLITITGYTISGTAAGNYTLSQPTGLTGTISAVGLTITGASASNKVYDATNTATITGGTLVGVLAADAGNVTLALTGTFATSNVGTGIVVTSTSTISGPASGNYTLAQPAGLTADITIATQTITFPALPVKTTADVDFSPGATSPTSGTNPITYTSSNTAVATIVSGNIHIVGVGTSVITASQAGNANYSAAANVQQTLTVNICIPGATSQAVSSQYISNVQLGLINHSTTASTVSYYDNTLAAPTANLNIGTASPISVTQGNHFSGDLLMIFIDWNGNGTFTDPGETVLTSTSINPTVNTTITPPGGASLGVTRMRIKLYGSSGGNTSPCGNTTFGSVQDFSVNVLGACSTPANPTGTITAGANPACISTNLSFPASTVPGVQYYWQSSAAGTSLTTATIGTPNFAVSSTNTYYVRAFTTGTACWSAGTSSASITVNAAAPATPTAATVSATNNVAGPCTSGNTFTYSVNIVAGVTYTWTLPTGGLPAWSIISGQGTNSITVNVGSAAGDVSVTPSNGCGNGTARLIAVSPVQTLGTLSSITGSATVCAGSSQTYSVTPVTNATTYNWTLPGGWTGSTPTNSITVIAGSSGTISVTAGNSCFTSAVAQTLSVTVTPIPAIPTATAGSFTGSNSFTANWNTVPGATGYYVDVYTNGALATDLFISEYVEGSSNNKYIEIFNGTGVSVNLANYELRLYANGSAVATNTLSLSGTLLNNSTVVYKNSSATIYGGAATANNTVMGFNGNDAIALYKTTSSSFVDIIGRIGEDPGTGWASGGLSTMDKTIVRLPSVNSGVTINPTTGFPTLSSEWTVYNIDDVSHLGSHSFSGGLIYVPGFQNVYTTDVTLDVTGLNPSTNYFYVVRSESNTCTSASSNVIPVTTTAICTTIATVTSFAPASGPVNSRVTIKGTNFTGATAVLFGTAPATSFTVVNSTTIVAVVPTGTPYDFIKVTVGGCTATAPSKFTLITNNGSCGTTGATGLTEPYISEVYDALSGSLSYVEIFNPTAGAIALGAYAVRVKAYGATGSSTTDYPLSGNIPSGAVRILSVGASSTTCPITVTWSNNAGSGFNGNDQVFLVKGTTIIDRVDNPNYGGGSQPGFSQARKATAIGPNTTYTATDWTISSTEDCSNLTVAPYSLTTNQITINTHPADLNCNSTVTFSVAATSSTGNYNYTWYFNDLTMNNWDPVSTLSGSPYNYPVTVTGVGTSSISITGSTAILKNFQFYVEVGSGGTGQCVVTSNAAQYTYDTRIAYRSKAPGNWSTPANWEMSDDLSTWVPVCAYPTAGNCDQVIIRNGADITLDIDNSVDKLTIDASATLTATANSELTVLNGIAGADFIVNGKYVDESNSANGLSFGTGASWTMAASATLIKSDNGSAAAYRDNYETGIVNIPATANWIIRHNSVGQPSFTTATGSSGSFPSATYYPNLTFESTSGNWSPASSLSRFSGNLSTATIKGNLDIGGTGVGTVTITNENIFASPILIAGNLVVRNGNTFTNDGTTISGTGLEVKGNVTIDGTFTNNFGNKGLLKLSGSSATQIISGAGTTNLQDLTIANTTNFEVLLNKSINIPGVLTLEPSSRLDLGSGDITLNSTATTTARVAPVGANAQVNYPGTGRFNVERYYPGTRAWRLGTSPLSAHGTPGTIFQQWQNNGVYTPGVGMFVSGPNPNHAINGLDTTVQNNYSMKRFLNNAYDNVASTLVPLSSSTATAAANIGYFMFVRGDRNRSPDNSIVPNTNLTTLTSRGKLQYGTQTFPALTRPAGNTGFLFTLVGNPYASPIDITTIGRTNVSNKFYVWDPQISAVGTYVTIFYNTFTGTYSITPQRSGVNYTNIQSSQAFFIETDVAQATSSFITINESNKTSLNDLSMFRPARPSSLVSSFRTNLYLLNSDNSTKLTDGNLVEFNQQYQDRFDPADDALKFGNVNETFGLMRSGNFISIERRPTITADDTLYFNLTKTTQRNYQFQFEPANLDPLLTAFLEDSYKGTKTPVSVSSTGSYNFTVDANAASAAANRFRIVFKSAAGGPLPVTFTGVKAFEQGKNIMVEWTVQNEINVSGYEVQKSLDGIGFTKVNTTTATGANQSSTSYNWLDVNAQPGDQYYRIRSIDKDGKTAYSRIVKVNIGKLSPAISVYPNPILEGSIGLQLTNMPAGKYGVKLINSVGQVLLSAQVQHSGGSAMQTLAVKQFLAKGIYQLQITHPNKTTITLKVTN